MNDHTFPAKTPFVLIDVSVDFIKRMSVFAMSFTGIGSRLSHDIDSLRDCLKMPWINTRRITAEMINYGTIWNLANIKFVCKTMCQHGLTSSSKAKLTISHVVYRSFPNMTIAQIGPFFREWPIIINFGDKSKQRWTEWPRHNAYLIITVLSLVR